MQRQADAWQMPAMPASLGFIESACLCKVCKAIPQAGIILVCRLTAMPEAVHSPQYPQIVLLLLQDMHFGEDGMALGCCSGTASHEGACRFQGIRQDIKVLV